MKIFGIQLWGGSSRHPDWPKFRDKFLENKSCAACGTKKLLEAHHKLPLFWGGAELDESNLIPLCRDCHFVIGHLKDWKSYNPNVDRDSQSLLLSIRTRPHREPEKPIHQ